MGALSFSLSEVLRIIAQENKVTSQALKTMVSLTPLASVLLLSLLILKGNSYKEILRLEVVTAMGVIASAPGQPTVARATADNEILNDRRVASTALLLGIIIPVLFSTILLPVTKQVMNTLRCKLTIKYLSLQYLVSIFYSLSTSFYALAVEEQVKYVIGMVLPWASLVVPTLLIHKILGKHLTYSLLISTTISVIVELILFYKFLYYPLEYERYGIIKHLRVAMCFAFDSLSLKLASTLYYSFLFADKIEWILLIGNDSLTIIKYAFIGSFPLIGGVLAGNAFWHSSGELLSKAYKVTRIKLKIFKNKIIKSFFSNIALAGLSSSIIANIVVLLETGYINHYLFISMITYMITYMITKHRLYLVTILPIIVVGDIIAFYACTIEYWSIYDYILCSYSVVGIIGSSLIYIYSQLVGLKRETEAAALMGIPVVTAMGIDWITGNPYLLPVGLASGALVAKILGTILLTVMYRELDATILRVLAYNSMVSYLLEVKGVVPDLEEGGE